MTTSKGYKLTADQAAAMTALLKIQEMEENNNFANGDLWNNIQYQIEAIEKQARQNELDKYSSPSSVAQNWD